MKITKTLLSLSIISALFLGSVVSTATADSVTRMDLKTNPVHMGVEKTGHLKSPVPDLLASEASHVVSETDPARFGVDVSASRGTKGKGGPSLPVDNVTAETDPTVFGNAYSHDHL